jgi:hypothetical protein
MSQAEAALSAARYGSGKGLPDHVGTIGEPNPFKNIIRVVFGQTSKAGIRKGICDVGNACKVKNDQFRLREQRVNLTKSKFISEITIGQERAEVVSHHNHHKNFFPDRQAPASPMQCEQPST